jgi:hypothetical protein
MVRIIEHVPRVGLLRDPQFWSIRGPFGAVKERYRLLTAREV